MSFWACAGNLKPPGQSLNLFCTLRPSLTGEGWVDYLHQLLELIRPTQSKVAMITHQKTDSSKLKVINSDRFHRMHYKRTGKIQFKSGRYENGAQEKSGIEIIRKFRQVVIPYAVKTSALPSSFLLAHNAKTRTFSMFCFFCFLI